jgi:hypothetical protein
MDPNEALRLMRENAKAVIDSPDSSFEARQLAEQFEGLDAWLSASGFKPLNWR